MIGWHHEIQKLNRKDAMSFYKEYYAPNNASLVIAGDFEKSKAHELVEKYFGSLPSGLPIPKRDFTFDAFNSGEKRTVVEDQVRLPRLYMAYHIPKYGSDEMYTADLITDVFSQGKSGRLYQE